MSNIPEDKIILRSVYSKTGIKIYTNPCRDPKTNRYPDCVKPVDSKNDMILSEKDRNSGQFFIKETEAFILEDGTSFNLNDAYEKAKWEAVKFCPYIAQSRDARDANGNLIIDGGEKRYGVAELYIERPGYEAQKRVSKKKKLHDACTYIYDDPRGAEGRLKIAKLLGKYMRNMHDSDVTDYLIQQAEKNPDKIISLYTGEDLNLRLLFIDAKEKHVIYARDKAYWFADDILLGATDDAVITTLKEPRSRGVLELITKATYPEMYEEEKKPTKK